MYHILYVILIILYFKIQIISEYYIFNKQVTIFREFIKMSFINI